MRTYIYFFWAAIFFLCTSNFVAQGLTENNWNWNETTVQDFSDNQLIGTVVTNISGGAVKLEEPVQQLTAEIKDNAYKKFTSRNILGNYAYSWVHSENVYVQIYDSLDNAISPVLISNDSSGSIDNDSETRVSLMDNGFYLVTWFNDIYISNSEQNKMYGQIFNDQNVKVGSNFIINDTTNFSSQIPVSFANESDQTFWIFYSLVSSPGYKIHAQKRDLNGEKVGETFLISANTAYALSVSVNDNLNDEFVLCWMGSNNSSSDHSDIYARKFNANGEPITEIVKINDDAGLISQFSPDVSFDDQGNFMILWGDWRDNPSAVHPYTTSIYAQIFDSASVKIGRNFKVNSDNLTANYTPNVQFFSGDFEFSWDNQNNSGSLTDIYFNTWKFDPKTEGSMISSVFDTGPGGAEFTEISWNENLPAGTNIKFQLRSSGSRSDLSEKEWQGPGNTADNYNNSAGEQINSVHNGDRYIQYNVLLEADEHYNSPILMDMNVTYIPADTIPPLPPQNLQANSMNNQIELTWDHSVSDQVAKYLLFKGTSSNLYKPEWTREISSSINSFNDTSVVLNKTYFYAVAAVDSSNNISSHSNEISASLLGKIYYVSNYGSITGDGSYTNPYLTITQAMDEVADGDTVLVLPGVYAEQINVKKGVALFGSGTDQTILESVDDDFFITLAPRTTLKDFTILVNHNLSGVHCDGGAILIEQNNFLLNESPHLSSAAIVCQNSTVKIQKNIIKNFTIGIRCFVMNSSERGYVYIKNNIIEAEYGIRFLEDYDAHVYNNTIILPEEGGMGFWIRFSNTLNVQNNIIAAKTTVPGFGFNNSGSIISSSYNNVWNINNLNQGSLSVGSGNISLDPIFKGEEGNNEYELAAGSPSIDAGNPDASLLDADGSRNDMGAFGGPDPLNRFQSFASINKIRISNSSGFPSDTVKVYVLLDDPIGLTKANINLSFNPGLLKAVGVNLTSSTSGFNLQSEIFNHGEIAIEMESAIAVSNNSSEILELLFSVDENAASGEASPVKFESIELFDSESEEIFLNEISHGSFIVNIGSEAGNYIFVDGSYTGTGDGTRQKPYSSINSGVSNAASGDTVVVAAGEYRESIQMRENVHLMGTGPKVTKMITSGENRSLIFENISQSVVSGFTFKREGDSPGGRIIIVNNSSPIIKNNNFITDRDDFDMLAIIVDNNSAASVIDNSFTDIGIWVSRSNPLIERNFIKFNQMGVGIQCNQNGNARISKNKIVTGFDRGISVYEANPTIENNLLINDHSGSAIYVRNSTEVKVNNNILLGNGTDGRGITFRNSNNYHVVNNTIISNLNGLRDISSSGNVYNNIFVNNAGYGLNASSTTLVDYNDVWNNYQDYLNCFPGDNDISADPKFINILKNDFNLSVVSPCRDAGHPNVEFNDLDGSRNDMGIYGGPYADMSWIKKENSSLSIDSVLVTSNDTLSVIIEGSTLLGIAEIDLTLSLDSEDLFFVDANTTDLSSSFAATINRVDDRIVKIKMESLIGIGTDNGGFLEVLLGVRNPNHSITKLRFGNAKLFDVYSNERNISNLEDGIINLQLTSVDDNEQLPTEFNLAQNYPNPFNPSTTIEYSLPKEVKVELVIYDILGRKVRSLINQEQKPGNYNINFNSNGLASGVYFYRLLAGSYVETKKMLLLK